MRMSLVGRTCLSQPALTTMKRHACIDLTEESDSETQECVSAEDRAGDSPIQWRIMMTKIIIGAFHWWCQDGVQMLQCDCFYYWAEAIKPDQLKFLLRRDVIMPALDSEHVLQFSQWWSTLTPELLEPQMHAVVPPWYPIEDYSNFFMRSKGAEDEASMLAVAELRWLASGGLLFMDSNVNIREDHERRTGTSTMGSHPGHHAHNRASRVDSIPPTKECMDLLACLEGWNNYQLPHELGNRTGGSTKPLSERQLPKELLSVLVEYTVSNCLQLVLSSTCGYLEQWCHFGSPDKVTRRWWVSPDADMRDILCSFLYVDAEEYALTATDTQGKVHDVSGLPSFPARCLPVVGDREVHLQVQVILHICDDKCTSSCDDDESG